MTYLARIANGKLDPTMDHLACFFAGNLELGYRTLPPDEADSLWHETAVALTRTCHAMYVRTQSGLSPEYVTFGEDMMIPANLDGRRYKLRPEVAESIYYLWYFTGEPVWQHMAKDILMAIETKAKARYGYAEVIDVDSTHVRLDDKMESYFLAE